MTLGHRHLFNICCICMVGSLHAQEGLTSKGTEFWMGFMRNYDAVEKLTLYITADEAASGTVSLPLQGWSMAFTATADEVAIVHVPVSSMHMSSEVVENKGVRITSDVPVSVSALSFEPGTAEASLIYPVASLGTEYRVMAYAGFPEIDSYSSELLVVATEDGTEVEIIPWAATLGGHMAGEAILVTLNAGESYQVCAATAAGDLTHSWIRTTEQSGPCRRIAVFGGSVCPQVPSGCAACDHIFEQQLALPFWGLSYHSVPWAGSAGHTYRILAHWDQTHVSVDNGAPMTLSSGQLVEVNGTNVAHCFSGDQPFSVAQYMEGADCGGYGDPAFVVLNAADQLAYDVSFTTMGGAAITDAHINVVVSTEDIGNVVLDGNVVPDSLFIPFAGCGDRSFAQLPVDSGLHRITCSNGFNGTHYGTGPNYESYAVSLGAYAEVVDPCATAVPEAKRFDQLLLSPNPAGDYFTLGGMDRARTCTILLHDALGALVRKWDSALPNEPLWIGDLPAGVYTAKTQLRGEPEFHGKLVVE